MKVLQYLSLLKINVTDIAHTKLVECIGKEWFAGLEMNYFQNKTSSKIIKLFLLYKLPIFYGVFVELCNATWLIEEIKTKTVC